MCLSSKGGREEVNIICATTVKVEIFTIGWHTFALYSDQHNRQLLSSSKVLRWPINLQPCGKLLQTSGGHHPRIAQFQSKFSCICPTKKLSGMKVGTKHFIGVENRKRERINEYSTTILFRSTDARKPFSRASGFTSLLSVSELQTDVRPPTISSCLRCMGHILLIRIRGRSGSQRPH